MSPRGTDWMSPTRIDERFPHQVGLPDDICTDRNYTLISAFLRTHALPHKLRRVQAVWPNDRYQDFRLHCFADRASAEMFQAHFGGEFFDPQRDREGQRAQGIWRRAGPWTRLLESGPLSVPDILRH